MLRFFLLVTPVVGLIIFLFATQDGLTASIEKAESHSQSRLRTKAEDDSVIMKQVKSLPPKRVQLVAKKRDVPHFIAEKVIEMQQDLNMVGNQAVRDKRLNEWSQDAEIRSHLIEALQDPVKARKAYGAEHQAVARVYAIEMFKTMLKNGKQNEVSAIISRMTESRELQKNIAQDKGRIEDYSDALAAFFRSFKPEQLSEARSIVDCLEAIGFQHVENKELKERIDREIYIYLYPYIGREKAAKLIDEAYELI